MFDRPNDQAAFTLASVARTCAAQLHACAVFLCVGQQFLVVWSTHRIRAFDSLSRHSVSLTCEPHLSRTSPWRRARLAAAHFSHSSASTASCPPSWSSWFLLGPPSTVAPPQTSETGLGSHATASVRLLSPRGVRPAVPRTRESFGPDRACSGSDAPLSAGRPTSTTTAGA